MVTSGNIFIDDAVFDEDYNGIFLGGVDNAQIINSEASIELGGPVFFPYQYDLYLNYCDGYQIEGNLFIQDPGSPSLADIETGTVVTGSGSNPNEIYRNTYGTTLNNMELGIVSQFDNSGLQVKCNSLNADAF